MVWGREVLKIIHVFLNLFLIIGNFFLYSYGNQEMLYPLLATSTIVYVLTVTVDLARRGVGKVRSCFCLSGKMAYPTSFN